MTYLLSSAGALIVDRNTWHSRADTAYGPGRAWNTAPSFEDQAWTGSGYGSGVLWSDAAHDDPNVWTTRYNTGYNAGYAQATTDKQPPVAVQRCFAVPDSQSVSGVTRKVTLASANGSAAGWLDGGNDRIVVGLSGQYYVVVILSGTTADPNSVDVFVRVNGSDIGGSPGGNPNSTGTSKTSIGAFFQLGLSAGNYVEVWAQVHTGTGWNLQGSSSIIEVGFIPIQAQPH